MHAIGETVALALLAASLIVAVARPRGLNESAVAVPAALLVVGLGLVPARAALDRLGAIGPTVAFLAGILLFGRLCARAGVFDYLGALVARAGGADPRRLLLLVIALAAAVTAVLTLDATVVLLTPVVLTTVGRLGVAARPQSYACLRLANSGSLLLPVSNLTNLLAFTASGLSFGRFAAIMALPWTVACGAEWVALRTFFRHDLSAPGRSPATPEPGTPTRPVPFGQVPGFALGVLALTVTGFVVTSSIGLAPAWAAFAGCGLLLLRQVLTPDLRRNLAPRELLAAANPGFCVFVLALAVVVEAVTSNGLAAALSRVIPSGSGLLALLAATGVAAALANLVNNLPATLALIPVVAQQPALVLAVLIGVNVGPNATYPGSLATLLWRRLLPEGEQPRAHEFHLFGALSVPLTLVVTTVALWTAISALGLSPTR